MLKTGLHCSGGILAFVGVGFITDRLWSHAGQLDLAIMGWGTWIALGFLSLVYGASNIFLALSWCELLKHFELFVPRAWGIWAWGVSQIAKYLPGNIFHLAGRQALGALAGYPHRPLAMSAVWELGLLATLALLFGVLILPLFFEMLSPLGTFCIFIAFVFFFILISKLGLSVYVSRSMFLILIYLTISAAVFVYVIASIYVDNNFSFDTVILLAGAFVFAWLAGLVTPGAPAGIGVRELVLMFLLKDQMPQAELAMGIALGRFVTTAGDGLFFIATSAYGRRFFSKASVE